jgi:hypothetical protein
MERAQITWLAKVGTMFAFLGRRILISSDKTHLATARANVCDFELNFEWHDDFI